MSTALPNAPKEVQEVANLFLQIPPEESIKYEISEVLSKTRVFIAYVEQVYHELFPSAQAYSDEHIAEHIFVTAIHKDVFEHYLKYEIWALTGSLKRLTENITRMEDQNENEERIGDEIRLLREIVLEGIEFIDKAHLKIKGSALNLGFVKRGVAFSVEIFSASKMLLREKIYSKKMGQDIIRPTSVFLIRQAIDIRIKNAFAIDYICDNRGKPLPVSWSHLIEMINDNPDHIEFPIKSSVLLKIHNWTQKHIHIGQFPNLWEVELAHFILEPLFASDEQTIPKPDGGYSREMSRFGSIKITKEFYERVEEEIKNKLASQYPQGVNVVRLPINPEAFIVEQL